MGNPELTNLAFTVRNLLFCVFCLLLRSSELKSSSNSTFRLPPHNLLFSDVGELKEYGLHYDNTDRSKGTAEVVFTHQSGALAAIKRYNNIQLDGRPMKIEAVGVNVPTHPVPDFASENLRASFQRPEGAAYGRAHIEKSHHKPVSVTVLNLSRLKILMLIWTSIILMLCTLSNFSSFLSHGCLLCHVQPEPFVLDGENIDII